MKKIYSLLILLLTIISAHAQVINEIDSDTPGTDVAEFIEILWTPNTSLNGLVVVLYNGSGNTSYAAFDLDGYTTDANGFFILGNTAAGTPAPEIIFNNGFLQNGADAVALYMDDATNFPNGTAVTSTNLIDALVYDTDDPDLADLLSGLGETVQYNENENTNGATESIQRKADGTYEVKTPTYRAANDANVCTFTITGTSTTCDAITSGTDTYTASFNFTGGMDEIYTVTSDTGTIGGDNPNTVASGTITITGISETTGVTLTVTSTLCSVNQTLASPGCIPASSLPVYEPFDYTVGANLGDQPLWTNINSGDEILIAAGNLSYSGLAAPTGNSVTFDGIGYDPAYDFTPVTSGTVYASFLFKVTSQSLVTDADGGYFAILSETTSSYDTRLWVLPSTQDGTATTFDIGFGTATSNPPVTGNTYNVGDVLFVVMSYDLTTGTTNLWVNPNSATFGGATPPTPLMTETDASIASQIGKFILRQDSATETPFITFDELRISDTWAGATPTGSTAVCNLSVFNATGTCDAVTSGIDTYTATFDFSGGMEETYTVTSDAGTISGDSPNAVASGTITVTGITEGTDVTLTITSTLCNVSVTATAPDCTPIATLPVYEPFDYTVGANLGDQPLWTNINTGDEILIASGNLSYSGLATPTGNSVTFDGAGYDPAYDFTPVTSGTVYASFLFKVTSQSLVTDADGGYFAILSETTSSYDTRLWVWPSTQDGTATTFDIGFGTATSNPPVTGNTYNVGDVLFVVMSYDLTSGTTNLWVNPDTATFGTSTPPTPVMTETDASVASQIGKFILRQDSATETPFITFDELRISDTWAGATPTGPLAVDTFTGTKFSMYPNPVNAGEVTIKSSNSGDVSVQVYDMLGKLIKNETLRNNKLNVANFNKGIYLVKITQGNATATQKLVVK